MRTIVKLIRGLRSGAAALVFGQKILQAWARNYLTRKLNESPDLEAAIGNLELRLLQSLAVVRDVRLTKLSGGRRMVEARCREISIHIQWRELLRGTLMGSAHLREPHIEIFADRARNSKDQAKEPQIDALLALCRETQRFMPFHLQSLEITEGGIDYVSQFTSPPFKLTLDRVSLSATHLTNIPAAETMAHVSVEGRTTGQGRFWLQLTLPSLADALTFDLQAGLNHVNLVDLNDLLRAYAKFDLKRGICSIYSEFAVEDGRYQGYIQPRFQNLDVFAWEKEHGKSFLQVCRHAVIAFLAGAFKNKPRDELALNVPISGTFDDADVDVWSAVGSLLRNAFIRALLPVPQKNASEKETRPRPRFRFWQRKHAPC